jgi:uncharacterized repeat protein (TIGR03803 family)
MRQEITLAAQEMSVLRKVARLRLIALFSLVAAAASGPAGAATGFSTLYSFQGAADGGNPVAGLIMDAAGNLFGTTSGGGASNNGTVFEIAKTSGGYASTPTTLVSFNGSDGSLPASGLIAAAGVLYGTTEEGGANGNGTVFELSNNGSGSYTLSILVSFNDVNGAGPDDGLIADAAGNLFGTTEKGGANAVGTVFEIAKTAGGYASTPTTLVGFDGFDGSFPQAGLITDGAGDLFGTTSIGANGGGTVFEIAKTANGYASAPTTLVSFNLINGLRPNAVIAGAAGDLFGTTSGGGANGDGTVFELVNNGDIYTLTTLFSFTGGADGAGPKGVLIADAAGDLSSARQRGAAPRATAPCSS